MDEMFIMMMFCELGTLIYKKKSRRPVQFVAKLVLVRTAWNIRLKTLKVRSDITIGRFVK